MVTVTQVRREGRLVHITAEEHQVTLHAAVFRALPLQEGEQVDWTAYLKQAVKEQYTPALNAAYRLLAAKACSSGEIRQKLKRAACLPLTIDLVVLKLEKLGFINDERFAMDWAESRARSAHVGSRRIADELRRKGIPEELIRQALEALPEEGQLDAAVALARSAFAHGKPGEDICVTRQKVLARLARRGYDWDTARRAVDMVLQGGSDED